MAAAGALFMAAVGCATVVNRAPPPTNERLGRVSSAVSNAERAEAAGDPSVPELATSARRAYDDAKQATSRGETDRADALLARAEADAELAVTRARRARARARAADVQAQLSTLRTPAVPEGADLTPAQGASPVPPAGTAPGRPGEGGGALPLPPAPSPLPVPGAGASPPGGSP
jgi:hypothetical protein